MEQRPASATVARRWRPWQDRHAAVWHQWVVPAGSGQVRTALTGAPDDATAGLALSPDETAGTLTATSRRWRGTWHDGRREGAADVELTRLSPHATLVELSLWPHGGARLLTGRRRRDRVADEVAGRLGATRTPTHRVVEPAVVRLLSPRPAGLPVLVWVALVALLFTPAVWAFVAAQGPTPVTEERALAEHRERLQQLTSTREAAAGAEPAEDDGSDDQDTTAADDGEREAATDDGRDAAPEDAEQPDREPADPQEGETSPPDDGDGDESASRGSPDEVPDNPEVGVYQYATDGGEAVAVPNGSREYPERTTISVTEDGCGYVERWSVLDERWDERETCTGDETGMASQTSYREFFGVEREHTFVCDEQRPAGAEAQEPGTSWTITCEAEDTRMDGTIEVLGLEVLDVGGTDVRTVHLRLEGNVSGDLEGRQETERWLALDHGGLLIREASQTRARVSSPMGEVDYREDYRLDLLSLRPRS